MLNNISITTKSLIAPLIACAMLLVITVSVFVSYTSSQSQIAQSNHATWNMVEAKSLVTTLAQAHASLFRTVSWQQAQVDAEKVSESIEEAKKHLNLALSQFKKLDLTAFGKSDAEIKKIEDTIIGYQKTAVETLDTIVVDSFLATMLMTDAHFLFIDLSKEVEALATFIQDQSTQLNQEMVADQKSAFVTSLIVSAVAIVFSIIVALYLSRAISRPVNQMTDVMTSLAEGNQNVEVEGTERRDEVGRIAKAVLIFKENAIERARMREEEQKNQEQNADRQRRLLELTNAFDQSITHVVDAVIHSVDDLHGAADSLSNNAKQTSEQTVHVSDATARASQNVQTVSSATTELSSSIQEISSQVTRASKISREAVTEASRTNDNISELANAAERIGQVVNLIKDIAEQTNLLALNATIESARAGEAGKGFAVVASEVKNLANQTGRATEEIAAQIGNIQSETNRSVESIQEISKTISAISELSLSIAGAIEEQSAATDEIARNVEHASDGTNLVTENIQGVAKAAEDTGTMANTVYESANTLKHRSEEMKSAVDQFLSSVRNLK
jgi:methyl-accepting chemotaxis protein